MNSMPLKVVSFLAIFLWSIPVFAEQRIAISEIPKTVDEFIQLQTDNNTPEGAAACFVIAMLAYANDEALARKFFSVSVLPTSLMDGPNGHNGKQVDENVNYHLTRHLTYHPEVPRSYVAGTNASNAYAIAEGPMEIVLSRNRLSERAPDSIRVYVASTGGATPRPITLGLDTDGQWRVDEGGSLFVELPISPQNN
jgi:hypothetical protein